MIIRHGKKEDLKEVLCLIRELAEYENALSEVEITVQELEKDGIVHREIYKEIPPKVEYSLTDFGKTLKPIVNELWSFGEVVIEIKEKSNNL